MRFTHNLNLLFFGLCLISLHGQTIRVVDAVTGYPIEDVVAYDTLTKNNATSDNDGQLDLSVFSADDELFFEHIGYESLIAVVSEVQLSKQISLYPDTQRLGEIVLSVSRTTDEGPYTTSARDKEKGSMEMALCRCPER